MSEAIKLYIDESGETPVFYEYRESKANLTDLIFDLDKEKWLEFFHYERPEIVLDDPDDDRLHTGKMLLSMFLDHMFG